MNSTIKAIILISCTVVVTVILTTLINTSIVARKEQSRYYPTTAVVIETNHADDYIVAINSSRTFVIYGAEDYHKDDYISILMDNRHTKTIQDDKIVDYRYTYFDRMEDGIWTVHTMQP